MVMQGSANKDLHQLVAESSRKNGLSSGVAPLNLNLITYCKAGIRQSPMNRALHILPVLHGEYGAKNPRMSYLG